MHTVGCEHPQDEEIGDHDAQVESIQLINSAKWISCGVGEP